MVLAINHGQMIGSLSNRTNINIMLKVTEGQGFKVKGQDQICNYVNFFARKHEQMIGS